MPRSPLQRSALTNKILTVKELADYLQLHPSSVYRMLANKQLPGFRVGSDWRFNIEEIDRWRLSQPTANKR